MKKVLAFLLLLCMTFSLLPAAQADHQFLLDSDTRLITEAELWEWDRESLSFMFNEIFARHGFTFDVGKKFYNWFNNQPWYKRIEKVDDQTAYDRTTDLEWKNYYLIEDVIEKMERSGHPYRKSPGSRLKSWTDFTPPGEWSLTGFEYVTIKAGQKLNVYSAPGTNSWRGANGKAMINTDGAVWAAGWDNGWLLLFYQLNKGGLRVGYVDGSKIKGNVPIQNVLNFDYSQVQVQSACQLTDDPIQTSTVITTLKKGQSVTYLTTVINQFGRAWDYVETTFNGQRVRAFIPSGSLNLVNSTEDLPPVTGK